MKKDKNLMFSIILDSVESYNSFIDFLESQHRSGHSLNIKYIYTLNHKWNYAGLEKLLEVMAEISIPRSVLNMNLIGTFTGNFQILHIAE